MLIGLSSPPARSFRILLQRRLGKLRLQRVQPAQFACDSGPAPRLTLSAKLFQFLHPTLRLITTIVVNAALTTTMSMISSCFGRGRSREAEREPLLPQYNDDTRLQRRVHQKLHTYQMIRALTKGFMPSNDQLITNLRTLLGSDVLNPDPYSISDSGRLLAKYCRQWLEHFIEMLQNKNSSDQIQDFIWFLTKSRISVDLEDFAVRTTKIRARADTAAGMQRSNR